MFPYWASGEPAWPFQSSIQIWPDEGVASARSNASYAS